MEGQAIGSVARKGQTVDPFIYILEIEGGYCDDAKVLQNVKMAVSSAIDRGAGGDVPKVARDRFFDGKILALLESRSSMNRSSVVLRLVTIYLEWVETTIADRPNMSKVGTADWTSFKVDSKGNS